MALCVAVTWIGVIAAERSAPNLPDWARAVISKQFGAAEILHVDREGDRDENRYEVKLREKPGGRRMSVDLTQDAGVTDLDEELKQEELPEKVRKALERAFPNARVSEAERNTDIRVSYSILLTGDGKKREVRISPRGKILEVERRD